MELFITILFQDERLRLLEIENARKAEKAKLSGSTTIVEDHNDKDAPPEHPSKAIGDDDHEWKQFEELRRQVNILYVLIHGGRFYYFYNCQSDLMQYEKIVEKEIFILKDKFYSYK